MLGDLSFMSLQVPSSTAGAGSPSHGGGGRGAETVLLAPPGAPHGRFAAFAAAPRVVSDVTATAKEIAMRPGRRVFADE